MVLLSQTKATEKAKPTPCRYDRTDPDESYNGKVWLVIEIDAMTADGSSSQKKSDQIAPPPEPCP